MANADLQPHVNIYIYTQTYVCLYIYIYIYVCMYIYRHNGIMHDTYTEGTTFGHILLETRNLKYIIFY